MVLFVAVIGLAAMTAPAVAQSIEQDDKAIATDEITSSGPEITVDTNLTLNDTGYNNRISAGDQIKLQLQSSNADQFDPLKEGSAEITDVSATFNDAGGSIDPANYTVFVQDGSVFTGTDDTVVVEATNPGGSSVNDANISIQVDIDLGTELRDSFASNFGSGEQQILKVTQDEFKDSPGDLTGASSGNVAGLDIQPGDVHEITFAHQSGNNQDVDTASKDIDVTAKDEYNNKLNDSNVAGGSLDTAVNEANHNVNVTVTADTNTPGSSQTSSSEFLQFNATPTETVTFGDQLDNTADLNHSGIGNYTIDISETNPETVRTVNTDFVEVRPDTLAVSSNTSSIGLNNAANITIDFKNNSDALASVNGDVELELGLTGGSGPVTISGNEISNTELSNGETAVVTVTQSQNTSTSAGPLKFTSNAAGTNYKLNASVVGPADVPTGSIDVLASNATSLRLTNFSTETQFSDSKEIIAPDVAVVDSAGNVVEGGQYASGETVLNYTLKSKNTSYSDSVTKTLTGASNTNGHISIGNDTQGPDLNAKVGHFTLEVTQENVDDLGTTTASVRFYPNSVTVSGFSGNTVGNNESFSVDLPDTTNGSIDEIKADVFINSSATQSQIGSETLLEGSVDSSIGEGQSNAATIDLSQSHNTFDFNTTNAGKYELNATVATSFNAENQSALTTSNETFSPDVPVQGTIAEQPSSFYGTVVDQQVDIKVTDVQDQFNNNADSGQGSYVANISDGTSNSATGSVGGGPNAYNADGNLTISLDPSNLANSTTTGDNAGTLAIAHSGGGDSNQFTSVQVNLTHEVLDIQEGFQPFSIPQDFNTVYTNNVSTIQYYENTPNSAGYNNSVDDLITDTSTNDELAVGHWVDGSADDARLGVTYRQPGDGAPTTDSFSLEAGYNLVGTNYNISSTTAANHDLDDDLRNIPPIDANLSAPVYGLDSSTSGGALDLTDDGDNASNIANDEYGAYWVKLDSKDDLTRTERDVVGPAYSPVSGNR